MRITGALGNEIPGADLPVEEPLRIEPVRIRPQATVVVLAMEIQQDKGTRRHVLALPRQVMRCTPTEERRERRAECRGRPGMVDRRPALDPAPIVFGFANFVVPLQIGSPMPPSRAVQRRGYPAEST
ncbi:hypothetical protein JOD27_004460 [Lentzea nigeriaca]|nr:hypothetical protein [Lentzea nigeriaca]MBM7860650.1 hypothetical protein [Lentzea nigeriaca]